MGLTIAEEPVDGPDATGLLWSYIDDVASRWWGRPATPDEVDAALAQDPSHDLAPPTGAFLVARWDGRPTGCVGIRAVDAHTAEVRRLYVAPGARGSGTGRQLLAAAERLATVGGATRIRLDTRSDLVEARALYVAAGYREVPPYGESRYSDRWYAKGASPVG